MHHSSLESGAKIYLMMFDNWLSMWVGSDFVLTVEEIKKRIPHRYPFLLIDRVIELEERKRAVALKNVSINEPFFQGHYPDYPIMPGVLIVEAMAQTGGLAAGGHDGRGIPLLASLNKVRFRKMVVPGDQLKITVEITSFRRNVAKANANAEVNGELVASAELTFALAERGEAF